MYFFLRYIGIGIMEKDRTILYFKTFVPSIDLFIHLADQKILHKIVKKMARETRHKHHTILYKSDYIRGITLFPNR